MVTNIVTGATGFLGGELSRRLVSQGERVLGVGRNKEKGRTLEERGIEFLELDLSDKRRVLSLLLEADYVFHCSALSSDWGLYDDFYNANVLSTRNVVGYCFKNAVRRLIYVSTPSLYLGREHRLGITEETPFNPKPLNDYTKTKKEAEYLIDTAYSRGLDVVTIRPRGIIGKNDDKIVPRIVRMNDRGIPFIQGGSAMIDLTSVENVVDALVLARDKGVSGNHYNITNGQPMSFSDIVYSFFSFLGRDVNRKDVGFESLYLIALWFETVGKIMRLRKIPLTRYSVCAIGRSQTFDLTKAKRELGYSPKKGVMDSLKEIADGFR
jgi:nucleoside-diphosphate-sugar epimerase